MQFENLSIGELEKNPDVDKRITKAAFNLNKLRIQQLTRPEIIQVNNFSE